MTAPSRPIRELHRERGSPFADRLIAEIATLADQGASALPRLFALYNSRNFPVKFAAATAICRIERPVELVWPAADEDRVEFARALLEAAYGPAEDMRRGG